MSTTDVITWIVCLVVVFSFAGYGFAKSSVWLYSPIYSTAVKRSILYVIFLITFTFGAAYSYVALGELLDSTDTVTCNLAVTVESGELESFVAQINHENIDCDRIEKEG